MKKFQRRLVAGLLALTLCGSLAAPAWAAEEPELPAEEVELEAGEEAAQLFSITVGSYTPKMVGSEKIRRGETYTLIALPAAWAKNQGDGNVATLTPTELIAATGQALFMGSAVASADGEVTFEDVRLRTADAAVYYVTGPGLDTPLYEATGLSTGAEGMVYTDDVSDHSATIALVDAVTGYRYGKPAQADASGYVSFGNLAPGTYNILITKPGYLPTTRTATTIVDGQVNQLNRLNISSVNRGASDPAQYRIGDVTGDASRNMDDLAALLMYYGRPGDVPQGITADLNGDGAVDQSDVSLLLTAAGKPTPKDITTGSAENVTGAKVTVADSGAAAGAALRSLSLGVETTATVSAAAFSITYRADAVQPLNAKGGLVSPVDGGTLANCLVPAGGVTARLTRWSVAGETVTLSFVLTADSPKAAGELAKFYYRPVSGDTGSFYSDVFTLDSAVAVVGKDTVVTDQTLTYPGSDSVHITGLTIDQQPAAGEDAPALTLPAAGRAAVLPLSATGSNGSATYPNLPGVTWTLARTDGESLEGVSVERGLLTVTSQAAPGSVQVTASRDGVTSQPLTVELKNAQPVAATIQIFKDGVPCASDAVVMNILGSSVDYTATVYDQYGQPLAQQPKLSWSLIGAPVGVEVEDGVVYTEGGVRSHGRWTVTVVAQAEGLQATLELDLTLTSRVSGYFVAGPRYLIAPEDGEEPVSYPYIIVGYDEEGRLVELTGEDIPFFGPTYEDFEGLGVSKEMDGSYSVTVSSDSNAIGLRFTFDVGRDQDPAKEEMTLTVLPYKTDSDAVRPGIFYDGEAIQVLRLSVPAGVTSTLPLAAHMLDRDGAIAADQPQEKWNWTGGCRWMDYSIHVSEEGELVVGNNVAPGTYLVNMSVDNPELRLAADGGANLWVAQAVIVLEVTPTLSKLELGAPATLNIPTLENLNYNLTVTGQDAKGNQVELPGDLVWKVTAKGGKNAPAGVSVEKGVLTVTAAAAPGDITVTVSDKAGKVTASADITLAPAGAETSAFVLYRQIVVDGVTVEKSAPVTGAGDVLDVKEGQRVEIRYTPMLVNQTTGAATAVRANLVKWTGGGDAFIVDANAENGVYSSNLAAAYNGQAAAATATVRVYPNITGLSLDFGDGQNAPPYKFTVPTSGARTYTATLMAQIKRGGATQTLPLKDLGLSHYDVVMATALTGLYVTLDKAGGTMTFTVEPAAVDNPTSAPAPDKGEDIRLIQLQLDYFPGKIQAYNLDFYLLPDTSRATQAVLRRGVGAGTSFVFDTPKEDNITAGPGVYSNCYALELLDQYKSPVVNETVTWTLTVPDELMVGGIPMVTMVKPSDDLVAAYPIYTSMRRLHILSGAPVGGPYDLALTASAAGFTCTRHISLTVRERDPEEGMFLKVSGDSVIVIPGHYFAYNSTTLNKATETGSFAAVLVTGDRESNEELDSGDYNIRWTVADPTGKVPAGVSIQADKDDDAYATLTVDRTAKPTGTNKNRLLTVAATVVDAQGVPLDSNGAQVELAREASVPVLMRIRKNGAEIARDSFSLAATDTRAERDYTFYLVDQYNQPMSGSAVAGVSWKVTSSSAVVLTTRNDQNGTPYAHVVVTNSGKTVNQTVYLTAAIMVNDPKAPGGKQEVSYQIPLSVSIAGNGGGGGGGGGGGMGDVGPGDTTTAGTPATISISGNTAITTNQGTAASRTYSFSLRDKNGNNCGLSEQNKVTWSVTGLTGGLTFNNATRTLTVPANALVGTYTVRLTAKYSSSIQSSVNVTVTVKAKEDDKTDQPTTSAATVAPAVTQSGTAGTATLTAEQEKALTAATAGGTVTIAPSGGSGLTSLSVNLTAITASALASQKNQSLKVQTALGTVVLPPAALRGLAGQGGSTVTVKLTSTGGGVQVEFLCGSSVKTLPAKVTVSLPTSGNVALQVKEDGSQSVLKKAIVQNGRVLAYVDGATQFKMETRTPVFSDTQNHWAQEAIAFTAARELFQGTSATTFSPNDTMTRSMVVTVLHRLEDTPAAAASAGFADVAQGTWYTAAVNWANAKGIVQGTANGFKPGDPVTREQLATILYRYASDQGLATSQRASLSRFSDSAKVSGWAAEAMQWAVSIGLINGKSGGVLDPTGNASRAEVSAILQRLIVYMAPTV